MKVIIDLEATCDNKVENPDSTFNEDMSEIIEIGACLIDLECNVVSEFQVFVKPIVQPRLTEFCTHLTHITQADVDAGLSFQDALKRLDAWFDECERAHGPIEAWGSWGGYDRRQFIRNCTLLKCEAGRFMEKTHINLKDLYGKMHRDVLTKKRTPGVGLALRQQGLKFEGTAHRAIDDAKNIARLCAYIFGHKPSRLLEKNQSVSR